MTAATMPPPVSGPRPATPAPPHLTRTLVRLKFRLLRNRAKAKRGGTRQLVVVALVGGWAAVFAISGVFGAADAADPRVSHGWLVLGCTVVFLGWLLFPLMTFGTDESLDPARLALFPLPDRPLVRGLLAASFVGIAPTAAAAVAIAVVVAYGHGAAFVVALPAMALFLVTCAASARALSTVMATGLRSRKGRDAVAFGGTFVFLALQGLRFIDFGAISPKVLERVGNDLRWFPPAMLGQSIIDADHGRWGPSVLELVPSIVLIGLALQVWAWGLKRSTVVVSGGQTSTKPVVVAAGSLPLLFRWLPFVRATPWGAVAAKELHYAKRDPRRKIQLFNSAVIGAALPIGIALKSGAIGPRSVLLATLVGYVLILNALNQFGADGGALWVHIVSGDTVRATLLGKNLAMVIEVAPVVVLAGIGLSAYTGGWDYLPAALILVVAGMGAGFATANVTSVRFPVRLPDTTNPFAGTGGGQGCVNGLLVFGCMIIQAVVLSPVVIATAIAVAVAPVSLVVVAPACAVYGALVYWGGLHLATGYGRTHLPEILAKVDQSRST